LEREREWVCVGVKIVKKSNKIKGKIQHDKTFAAAAATTNLKKNVILF
jgi:hypothetical protein